MFEKLYDFEPLILRPSNPYGPGQSLEKKQGIIAAFIQCLVNNEATTIWGDGSVKRDFIYISDLIELIVKSANTNVNGVFNAGSGIGLSLNELIAKLENVSGKQLNVKYVEGRKFDVKEITLNISAAKNTFNWAPIIDIEQGMKLFMDTQAR